LRELLSRHAPRLRLAVRDDLAMIAVQGPAARAKVWQVLPQARSATETLKPFSAAVVEDLFIARTGYTGEDGFEIMMPAARAPGIWRSLVNAGVRPCGLGARDTLRLEAGMNLYGQEMDETVSPLEAGLAWTVDLASPREFVGKAALLAKPPARQQIALVLLDKGGVLRAHQAVKTTRGPGEITSGTFSPTLGRSIAFARVPLGIGAADTVHVIVRDKALAARVVKPPFARNGQSLVQPEETR
jgi:aminomethyltransferase